MRQAVIFLLVATITSCIHPYYVQKNIKNFRTDNSSSFKDDIHISSYHFSAGMRKGSHRVLTDTLEINTDIDNMLQTSLVQLGFEKIDLVHDKALDALIDPKLRWRNRKLKKFLQAQVFDDNTLVPIICYNVSIEPEREGGGGLVFVYKTGNDSYLIGQQLYLAFYRDGSLAYLNNVSRWDEKVVPGDKPIKYEFPQEVLDTLMYMAIEPLLKKIDKQR